MSVSIHPSHRPRPWSIEADAVDVFHFVRADPRCLFFLYRRACYGATLRPHERPDGSSWWTSARLRRRHGVAVSPPLLRSGGSAPAGDFAPLNSRSPPTLLLFTPAPTPVPPIWLVIFPLRQHGQLRLFLRDVPDASGLSDVHPDRGNTSAPRRFQQHRGYSVPTVRLIQTALIRPNRFRAAMAPG
jgi:hypothetical protein